MQHDATLQALLDGLKTLDDPAVCLALADYLNEIAHPEAEKVCELVHAVPVIPIEHPCIITDTGSDDMHGMSLRVRTTPEDLGTRSNHNEEVYPIACGAWWRCMLRPWCVETSAYRNGPEMMLRIRFNYFSQRKDREECIRKAFEAGRRYLIWQVVGYVDPDEDKYEYDEIPFFCCPPAMPTTHIPPVIEDPFADQYQQQVLFE